MVSPPSTYFSSSPPIWIHSLSVSRRKYIGLKSNNKVDDKANKEHPPPPKA